MAVDERWVAPTDDPFALTVEIPSGLIQPRLLSGVPLPAALVLGCVPLVIGYTLGLWYGALSLLPLMPVWGFLRYWTKKDPHWCEAWLLHRQYATLYRAG
jgi:type IV secretory pathway TrbD component